MEMNPIAIELNEIMENGNPNVFDMLSVVGKNLFFPKGILSQSAEAKEKAHKFNATIGMATEKGNTMFLPSIMAMLNDITPTEALTYAPSFGILPLREAWKEEIYRKNPSLKGKDISLPVTCNAITHALSVASDMWVDPGDVILLPDKMWGNYNLIFAVRKGAGIRNYTFFDANGGFNMNAFKTAVMEEAKERKKIIVILNFPNNPTGYTISSKEASGIADILENVAEAGTHVVAFLDDAYFGLFYEDGAMKESIFTLLMDRNPNLLAVKLDGATKENFVWGLRVGFVTYGCPVKGESRLFYDALEKKTAGAVRGSISNASHLSQELVLKSLQSDAYLAEKQEKFEIMRDRAAEVKRVLANAKYADAWDVYPFNSGYFMCLKLKTVHAEPLRVHLLNKYGVGLIALGETDLRVAFSCLEKEDTEALFDTVLRGVEDLSK